MCSEEKFTGEKYNLRWNSHKNSLVNYLRTHLAQEDFVDCTLACEGKYLKAHKLILSACSSYFKELFQIHNVDKPLIILNNVKFKQLRHVIDFIYTGEIKVLDSELDNILTLGNNLQIKGLSNIQNKNVENKNGPQVTSRNKDSNSNVDATRIAQKNLQQNVKNLASKGNLLTRPGNQKDTIKKVDLVEGNPKPKRRKVVETVKLNETCHTETEELGTYSPSTSKDKEKEEKSNRLDGPQTADKLQAAYSESAFMIFAREWRKKLSIEHPDETTKQISVRLSNMWKTLSEKSKGTFYEVASKGNTEHKEQGINHS